MQLKNGSKRSLLTLSLAILLVVVIVALAGILIIEEQQQIAEQNKLQESLLAELDARVGDYDETKIVLNNTSHSRAQSLAEAIGAKLRITKDGSFATLTLTDDRTIRDVVANEDNKALLESFGIDYKASVSDLEGSEEEYERTPKMPNGGYISQEELGDYLGYMNIGDAWNQGYKGNGVTVAIIDSGIDTDHPEFAGRISEYSYNATEDKIVKDWILEDGSYDWSLIEDEQGHGTAVAGTLGAAMDGVGVTGIAPEVTLIVIKAECDEQGRFKNTSDLVFGLYYAIERDADVVNMSFGTSSNVFGEAAQLAYDSDIICVAAAGNESTAMLTYPAADPHVIGVGALEDDGWDLADYSNYGENVNVVAPGTVYTAKNGGDYATINGTSFSSPLVAGVISLFMQINSYTTFDDVCEVLYASSYDLGTPGTDFVYGYGAVDVNAFILEERGTITYDMMTDELEDEQGLFIRNHTIQSMLEPERLYAVFDGWYYDPHYVQEFAYYEDRVISDITLYAKWVSEDDEVPYTYRELDDGTIEITGYRGKRRFISVPEYIDGKLVTSIGANAFSGQTRLREVNLPAGINNIGAGAFLNCTNITRIDIPENVTTIGASAFNSCVRLAYINFSIHPKLTYIGDRAFAYCASLLNFNVPKNVTYLNGSAFFGATAIRSFTVDKNNTNFLAEDGVLFNSTKSTLVAYPANRTAVYTVPNTVATIGTCAFGFTRASSVDLGNVQTIGGSAFQNSALTSIVMPDTVTTLGASAFAYTNHLGEVTLSNNLTKIPFRAFYVSAIQAVTIPNSVRGIDEEAFDKSALMELVFQECSQLLTIGGAAFSKTSIIEVELPASLVSIGAYAFYQNKHLSAITFEQGSNLISIGVSAFEGESTLTSISLPESLRSIGDFAFSDSGITGTQHIPQNLSYFGEGAFASCSKLTGFDVDGANNYYNSIDGVVYSEDGTRLVAYPAGNTNYDYAVKQGTLAIGGAAFYGAQYVTQVNLNDELEDIGNQSFAYATSLNYMQIPDNTIKIGRYAFEGTSSLTTVSFSENAHIARLGFAAFANSGIQYITIPKNVSTMAQKVFEGCDNLYSITFAQGSKLESISAYMFDGCSNLQTITFESGSALTSIQAHGLEGMKNLQSIDFGDAKLTNIDNFAFRFCNSLTEFNIPDTVTNIGRYAFYYCENLSSVTIPASVEHIGSYAFLGTKDCELFFVSETLPEYLDEDWDRGVKGYYLGTQNVTTDGDWTYATLASGNIAILKYTGSDEVIDLNTLGFGNIVTIGGKAFAFSQVKHITLPNSLVTIQAEAFFNSELEEITIPSTVEFIGKDAFYNTPINSLTFEDNSHLKVIEQSAFENTKELDSVTLPASLTQMGTAVFRNSGITSVTFANGIGLTEIANEAFAYTQLESVTIPNSIIKVGDGAFRNCQKLATFNYGDQQLWLGANAFYDSGLTSFHISENLYVIEEFALASLNELTAFSVDEANAYYKEVDGCILLENGKKLVAVPAGRTGNYTIPQSVEILGFGSFEATELDSVSFPENTNILCVANRAFFGAENLAEITIPQSVVSIDYYAFAYAKNLEKVIFEQGSRLTGIYEGAFIGCSKLSDILLPDTIVEISDFAFYGCESITELPISENSGLKGIYSHAFAYTGLTELVLPKGIVDIDDYSFMGTDLTKVVISNASEKELRIGLGAFEGCNVLEYIELPFIGASYEDYRISWFGYIFGAGRYDANQAYIPESLKTVKINGSITFVGNNAFWGVTSIDSVDLPHTVDTLYNWAFTNSDIKYEISNPVYLRENYYSQSTVATHEYFGYGITGSLVLSDSITDIDFGAFSGCDNLTSVFIPSSIINIGEFAFSDCDNLTNLTIPEGIANINDGLLNSCSSLTTVVIPSSVTSIGEFAFNDCHNLNNITIPENVTSIGRYAFQNCTKLITVYNQSDMPITLDNYQDYGSLTEHAKLIIDRDGNKIYRDESDQFIILDTAGGFRFKQNESGYKLVAYLGSAETVTLPLTINGNNYEIHQMSGARKIVIPDGFTIINDNAFKDCTSLTGITIPDSVTSIGNGAFNGCSNLVSVAIPDSVIAIGEWAFNGCSNLTSVVIPDSVTDIGSCAFSSCSNLTSVVIPNSVTNIDSSTFSYCTSLISITIPDSVKSIGHDAFYGCESLENVYINDISSWCRIEFYNFDSNPLSYAENLYVDDVLVTQVAVPQGITNICSYAFCNFDGLTYIFIPESVTEIGTNAFVNSSARIFIDENNSNFAEKNGVIYDKDFTRIVLIPSSVTEITIPKTVLQIGEVFKQNTTITKVSFEEGTVIDYIPDQAFYGCVNLTSITIPDGVTSIAYSTFNGCTSLASITIPDSVTSIESSAFSGCSSLTSISIPDGVTTIGSSVFNGCTSLTSITIPDSVTSIESSAFSGCASLTSITIPYGVTTIGYGAFEGCSSLNSIVIPDSVNSIEPLAFLECSSLTSIEIPHGVMRIEYLTFAGCSSLTNINIPDSITAIEELAFSNCVSLNNIVIPNNVEIIGERAFSGCVGLTSIIIPSGITTIDFNAFDACTNLQLIENRSNLAITFENSLEYGSLTSYAKLIVDKDGNKTYRDGYDGFTYIDTPEGFRFIKDGSEYQLIAYLGSEEMVTLPLTVNGNTYKIHQMSGIKGVIIPNGFTRIDDYAFAYCHSLTDVVIADSVTEIGSSAFYQCSHLTSIIIPDSVMSIGWGAFYGCEKLSNISLPNTLKYIEGSAFADTAYYNNKSNWTDDGCLFIGNHLIEANKGLVEYSIPANTISIARNAFEGCYSIKSLEIMQYFVGMRGLDYLSNLETLVIYGLTSDCIIQEDIFSWTIPPMTLKSIVLKGDSRISQNTFANIAGITILVEGEEKDLRWDDNFPGWSNGNKVVYGDKWIEANFFDQNGECISRNFFTTYQVIRVPYLEVAGDAQYSYIVEGFDLDGDGIADTIPATSSVDINATAVVRQVVNNYTVTFRDGDRVITTMTLPYGATITLPENPTKTGYDFVGWYGYTEGMKVTGNVTINSKWQHHGEGHVYGEMVHIDATCEEQGFDKYTCTICGEWYGENYTDALGHSYTTSVVDATCTEDGYTLYACECGYSYKDAFVDALGHSYGELVIDVDATCTTDGQGHKVCEHCSDVLEESIPAIGHEFTSTIINNSTCETAGTIRYECHCGYKVDESLPLNEHNYQKQYANKSFLEWLIEWLLNIFYGYEGNQAYYFKCSGCGHIATEEEVELSTSASVMAACVHKLGEFELVKDATCQEVAVYGKKCSLCGEMVEAKIGALSDHTQGSAVVENNLDPTCTEDGHYDNVVYCTVCNAELSRDTVVVDALGHDTVHYDAQNPTCTDIGWNAYVTCSRCSYSTYQEIPATGHSHNAVVTQPTCTTQGYTTHTCHCGDSYVDSYVDALSHTEVVDKAVAPTCTTTGLTEGKHCSVCNEVLVLQTVVPALGHSYSAVVTAPTCTEQGYTTYTCRRCGDNYKSNYVEATGHIWVWVIDKQATYTETGLKHQECSICHVTQNENTVIPVKTHECNYVRVVTTAPTCTQKGVAKFTCSECGDTYTQDIVPTGHTYNTVVTNPTCTEQGYTTYTCHCGDTYVADEVSALGHTVVVAQAVDPTCTTTGLTEGKHCSVCNEVFIAQETVPATGHSIGEWTVSTAPTCTEAGEERRDCNNCAHYETKELAALGHDYSNGGSCALCGKLSDGAVAGIVAGSAVAVGGGGFSLFWFVFRKKRLNIKK